MKFLPFFFVFFLLGCVKNNEAPVWLEVNKWTLEANPNSQNPVGELSHALTDAAIYVNDQFKGIFELPVKIPLLDVTGAAKVSIFPVVVNNGISATKKLYPFTETYYEDVVFVQNQTVMVNPRTRYYKDCQFWIEDFEDAAVQIETDDNSLASFEKGSDPAKLKYGNYYGLAELNTSKNLLLAYTNGKIPLPRGKEVYLEIDYRSTNSLVTGLIEVSATNIQDHVNIQMNAQPAASVVWKKIYIDLKELVGATPNAEYYEVSFSAQLGDGLSSSEIIIDNVKLIHF